MAEKSMSCSKSNGCECGWREIIKSTGNKEEIVKKNEGERNEMRKMKELKEILKKTKYVYNLYICVCMYT